jgi:hypothetical protein
MDGKPASGEIALGDLDNTGFVYGRAEEEWH